MSEKVTEVTGEIWEEIKKSITGKEYGSVEIYIESGEVVQITERTIKKTNGFRNGKNNIRAYHSNVQKK